MSHFIVRSQEKADELREYLGKHFYLNDPAQFISLYNAGIIARKHDEVDELKKLFAEAYKDVIVPSRWGGHISMISEEEVVIAEAVESLLYWEKVSKIKRCLEEAVQEYQIRTDRPIIIQKVTNPTGYSLATLHSQQDEETGMVTLVPEPLPRSTELNSEEAEFASEVFAVDNVSEEVAQAIDGVGVLIDPQKILAVDTSRVLEVAAQVPQYNH